MTPRRQQIAAAVSMLYPNAGPCAFCGLPDKRHRLFEAIQGANQAGDSIDFVSHAYAVPPETVAAIVEAPKPTVRDWEQMGAIQP